jgi:membrane protein required for colicin V production
MICVGLYRGFVKEILGLIGLVASISLAIVSNRWIVDHLLNYDNDQFLSSTLAYILSFLFFSIIFGIIISLILRVFKRGEISISDRLLGAIIGGVKAYLLCLLFYFVIYGFNSTLKPELSEKDDIRKIGTITPDWLKDSKTYPFFYNSVLKLDDLLKKLLHEKKEVIDIDGKHTEERELKNELEKKEYKEENHAMSEERRENESENSDIEVRKFEEDVRKGDDLDQGLKNEKSKRDYEKNDDNKDVDNGVGQESIVETSS